MPLVASETNVRHLILRIRAEGLHGAAKPLKYDPVIVDLSDVLADMGRGVWAVWAVCVGALEAKGYRAVGPGPDHQASRRLLVPAARVVRKQLGRWYLRALSYEAEKPVTDRTILPQVTAPMSYRRRVNSGEIGHFSHPGSGVDSWVGAAPPMLVLQSSRAGSVELTLLIPGGFVAVGGAVAALVHFFKSHYNVDLQWRVEREELRTRAMQQVLEQAQIKAEYERLCDEEGIPQASRPSFLRGSMEVSDD